MVPSDTVLVKRSVLKNRHIFFTSVLFLIFLLTPYILVTFQSIVIQNQIASFQSFRGAVLLPSVLSNETTSVTNKKGNPTLKCEYEGLKKAEKNVTKEFYGMYLQPPSVVSRTSKKEACSLYVKATKESLPTTGFPLAFAFNVHDDPGILETSLRMLFRPYHSFCVFIDEKAPQLIHTAIRSIIKCYQIHFPTTTIFVADNLHKIYWGHISILKADLKCFNQLRERNQQWHYVFNWAGSELPLKSIQDLEALMSSANKSIVQSNEKWPQGLTQTAYGLKNTTQEEQQRLHSHPTQVGPTGKKLSPPPIPTGSILRKGLKEAGLARDFVQFLLENQTAVELLNWAEDVNKPEEMFYATLFGLYYNISPNNFSKNGENQKIELGEGLTMDIHYKVCLRFSRWNYNADSGESKRNCRGGYRRHICQLSVSNMLHVLKTGCLVANKFAVDVDPAAIICVMEHVSNWRLPLNV